MKFNEIVAPSMKELFVSQIENLILSGQLKVGERFPTERELAEQMKISRAIVNLGMGELMRKGFVKISPRKGAVVADYVKDGNLDTLYAIINYNGGRFDRGTLFSIMTFRKINESEGCFLAALHRTDDDVLKLKEIYENILVENDVERLSKLFFNFHHTIFCASENNIYPLVYNAFEGVFMKLMTTYFLNAEKHAFDSYLYKLISAIENKNAALARQIDLELMELGISKIDSNYNLWF